jgi:penicillin-binding protein 2
MGFGSRTGIGIDREIPGIMPDRQYYVDRRGYYAPGFVVNNSIGQGDVAVTSLQLAMAYAVIANGGTLYQPQVVREIVDLDGKTVKENLPKIRYELEADVHHLELVREALSHVTEPGGTASGLHWRRDQPEVSEWVRKSGIKIGGKTGTAQVVRLAKNIAHIRPEDEEYMRRDHAWFVGMAPALDPEVVVVTMTEHGGFGGSASAPVVARVIKAYYDHVRGRGHYAHLLEGEDVDTSHEELE